MKALDRLLPTAVETDVMGQLQALIGYQVMKEPLLVSMAVGITSMWGMICLISIQWEPLRHLSRQMR